MITSITFILQFLLISFTYATGVSFKDITLIDSYTRNQNCTDLSHYFLIEATLFVPKGTYKDDIFFNVPSQFDFFPNIPLNITSNNKQIASVYSNDDNMFGINFPTTFTSNTTIKFNILTKLSNSTISSISIGDKETFSFRTTTGNLFESVISFVGKDTTRLTTNGGSFGNNDTAWFTADIPVSLLTDAVTFQSVKAGENDYKYNYKATKLEVVTSVDSLGNPLTSVPFTAYTDKSTSDEISITIDTRISGSGKFVRIHYFTEKLDKTPISNSVSLTQTSFLNKRDLTDSTIVSVYDDDFASEDSSNAIIESVVPTTSAAIATGYLATPLYSNNTRTGTASSSAITTSTPSAVSILSDDITTTEISSTIPTGLITTAKIFDAIDAFSTTSPLTIDNTTKPQRITSDNIIETYEIITTTDGAIVTQIGSYVAISTIKPTTRIQVDAAGITLSSVDTTSPSDSELFTDATPSMTRSEFASSTTVSSVSSSTISPTIASSGAFNSTTSSDDLITTAVTVSIVPSTSTSTSVSPSITTSTTTVALPSSSLVNPTSKYGNVTNEYFTDINGAIESKTIDAVLSVATDLIPVTTLSNGTVTDATYTDISASIVTKTKNAIDAIYTELVPVRSIHNLTTTVSCSTDIAASTITKTKNAINAIYTELVPVRSIHNLTTTVSCSTDIAASVITKTQTGIESVSTGLVAIGTLRNKTTIQLTSTHVRELISTVVVAPNNTVYSDIVPVATLSTETQQHAILTTLSPIIVTSTAVVPVDTIEETKVASTTTITSQSSSQQSTHTTQTISSIPSVQVDVASSVDFVHTTISIRPYEAASNKLALGFSSFIIALLTALL